MNKTNRWNLVNKINDISNNEGKKNVDCLSTNLKKGSNNSNNNLIGITIKPKHIVFSRHKAPSSLYFFRNVVFLIASQLCFIRYMKYSTKIVFLIFVKCGFMSHNHYASRSIFYMKNIISPWRKNNFSYSRTILDI